MEARNDSSLSETVKKLAADVQRVRDVNVPADALAKLEAVMSLNALQSILMAMTYDYEKNKSKLLNFLIERKKAVKDTHIFTKDYEHSKINDACRLVAMQLNPLLSESSPILEEFQEIDYSQPTSEFELSKEAKSQLFAYLQKLFFEHDELQGMMSIIPEASWKYLLSGILWNVNIATFAKFMVRHVEKNQWQKLLKNIYSLQLASMLWKGAIDHCDSRLKNASDEEYDKQMFAVVDEQFEQLKQERKQNELLRSFALQPEEMRAMTYVYAYLYEVNREKQHRYKTNGARVGSRLPVFSFWSYDRADKVEASKIFRDFLTNHSIANDVQVFFNRQGDARLLGALQEDGSALNAIFSLYEKGMRNAEAAQPAASRHTSSV